MKKRLLLGLAVISLLSTTEIFGIEGYIKITNTSKKTPITVTVSTTSRMCEKPVVNKTVQPEEERIFQSPKCPVREYIKNIIIKFTDEKRKPRAIRYHAEKKDTFFGDVIININVDNIDKVKKDEEWIYLEQGTIEGKAGEYREAKPAHKIPVETEKS